jgi:hypothetical protein
MTKDCHIYLLRILTDSIVKNDFQETLTNFKAILHDF